MTAMNELEEKFTTYLDDTLANSLLSTREIASGLAEIVAIDTYATAVMILIRTDMANGIVPATVRTFTALHDFVDANEYLLEAVPYDGPECTCPKNRNLQPEHSPDCLTFDSTAWQVYMDLTNKVADEVNRRLSSTHQ